MKRAEAINLMKTSETIEKWNLNRETVKKKIPITKENQYTHVLREIDGSGLISKVIKPTKQN